MSELALTILPETPDDAAAIERKLDKPGKAKDSPAKKLTANSVANKAAAKPAKKAPAKKPAKKGGRKS